MPGGSIDTVPIEAFAGDAQQLLLARFNAERDAGGAGADEQTDRGYR